MKIDRTLPPQESQASEAATGAEDGAHPIQRTEPTPFLLLKVRDDGGEPEFSLCLCIAREPMRLVYGASTTGKTIGKFKEVAKAVDALFQRLRVATDDDIKTMALKNHGRNGRTVGNMKGSGDARNITSKYREVNDRPGQTLERQHRDTNVQVFYVLNQDCSWVPSTSRRLHKVSDKVLSTYTSRVSARAPRPDNDPFWKRRPAARDNESFVIEAISRAYMGKVIETFATPQKLHAYFAKWGPILNAHVSRNPLMHDYRKDIGHREQRNQGVGREKLALAESPNPRDRVVAFFDYIGIAIWTRSLSTVTTPLLIEIVEEIWDNLGVHPRVKDGWRYSRHVFEHGHLERMNHVIRIEIIDAAKDIEKYFSKEVQDRPSHGSKTPKYFDKT